MSEEKIINGIDVCEWELKGVLIPITECKYFEGIGDCKESKGLCVDNDNCYFKQLAHLQEENEELKTYIQKMDKPEIKTIDSEIALKNIELQQENEELKTENEQLKKSCLVMPKVKQLAVPIEKYEKLYKALEEIRKEIGDLKDINKLINSQKILDTISEALNDRD